MNDRNDQFDQSREQFLLEFTKIRNPLYAYIFSILPHRDDAEDVFQRTSLILWQKIDQFDPDSSFYSWACGVAFYEAKNFKRIASRKRLQFSDDLMKQIADERSKKTISADGHHGALKLGALHYCLKKLRNEDQELLQKTYSSSDSVIEIAKNSGKAVQSLYNRLNLLRGQLAICIEKQLTSPGNS